MTQNIMIKNMIEKYCEVYQRCLDFGYSPETAHAVTKQFFDNGFAQVRGEA